MAQHGYDVGDPFGDPSKFTRSTGEDEVNRFNEWMRSQPWWQQIRGSGTGDVTPAQEQQIAQAAQAQGITVPHDFHIDQGGNFNQKGRTKRNLIIAGLAGAAALTGGGALGFGPMAGVLGGAATAAPSAGFIGADVAGTAGAALGGTAAATGGGILSTLGGLAAKGKTLTDLGNTLSQGAAGMADGRRADSTADMYAANANNNARVNAAQFNVGVPMTRSQQVARGDLMSANIPQSQATGSGRNLSFSGGIGPQSFGADTTQAGNELKRQALLHLMSNDDHLDPQITQPRKAGLGENLMAGAGMTSNILGTLGRFGGR